MKLTRAGEYAVRCILYLAGQEADSVVPRRQIAGAMEIPEQFLSKIAQELAHAGFLEMVQGARGGLRLVADPAQLSLLDVVEVIMGEIFLNDCILRPDSCARSNTCAVHRIWQRARAQLRLTLRQATFAKLLEEESCLRPADENGAQG